MTEAISRYWEKYLVSIRKLLRHYFVAKLKTKLGPQSGKCWHMSYEFGQVDANGLKNSAKANEHQDK